MDPTPPRVFISYARESESHAEWVRALAGRLRRDGVDAWIDQYEPFPPKGDERFIPLPVPEVDGAASRCPA